MVIFNSAVTEMFLILLFPILVLAQSDLHISVTTGEAENPIVRYEPVDANHITVSVTSETGVAIGDLGVENFEISTDLCKAEIYRVEPLLRTERANVAIALCIDNSKSMRQHLEILKKTLNTLIDQFGPSVQVSSIFFQARTGEPTPGLSFKIPRHIRIYDFTQDKEVIRATFLDRLVEEKLIPATYLFDEIYSGILLMQQIEDPTERRFMIILSDGQDNGSEYSEPVVNMLMRQNPGIVFYTIDYLQEANPILQHLALFSGGRHFEAKQAEELETIFSDISQDITKLTGYLITYHLATAYVAGRVVSGESCEPLTGVKFRCYLKDRPEYEVAVELNERGQFTSQLAAPYQWVIRAATPNYLADSTIIDAKDQDMYLVDLFLNPAYFTMRGRVSDLGGDPLPNAQIIVTDLNTGDVLHQGFTNSAGVYEFRNRVGNDILITANKDGFTYASIERRNVTSRNDVPDIELGLTAEGFVSEFRFLFEFNSDKLNVEDIATQTQLQGCIEFVKRELAKGTTRMVRLVGWTDSLGTAGYNLDLSNRRAQYVKNYLIKNDIPSERMVAEGKGISFKYDNTSEEGRALNRRTDVVFFDEQAVVEKIPVQN